MCCRDIGDCDAAGVFNECVKVKKAVYHWVHDRKAVPHSSCSLFP